MANLKFIPSTDPEIWRSPKIPKVGNVTIPDSKECSKNVGHIFFMVNFTEDNRNMVEWFIFRAHLVTYVKSTF